MDDALQDYLNLWDKRMEAAQTLPEDQQKMLRFSYHIFKTDLATFFPDFHDLRD